MPPTTLKTDIKASTPSPSDQTIDVPSHLKTPRPSASTKQTTAFQSLLDILLDLKRQQYGLEFEMNDLKKAFMSTSVSLQE